MEVNLSNHSTYGTYDPAAERRTQQGSIRIDGVLWERWYMFRNGDIWQYNTETKEWRLETADELSNKY